MPPAVTKELRVVYGAQTIGGTSDWELDRGLRIFRGYSRSVVEFDAVYSGAATQPAFGLAVRDFEASMRTPRQRLRVLANDGSGDETLLDLDPVVGAGTNTGFNADPAAQKVGADDDTGRSRRYRCRIEVETPADLAGQSGRRESTIDVEFSASRRRTLTIGGVYTALGANGARAQYNASIAAYRTAIVAGLGGNWAAVANRERIATDDADKLCTFSATYREIRQDESTIGLDDPELVDPSLSIRRLDVGPGDSHLKDEPRARRLVTLDATFRSPVDVTAETDLARKWTDDIRQHVLDRISEIFGLAGLAVLEEEVTPDDQENVLEARMRLQGAAAGAGGLVEATESTTIEADEGKLIARTWGPTKRSGYVFDVPAASALLVTTTITELEAQAKGSKRVKRRTDVDLVFLRRTVTEEKPILGLVGEDLRLRRTRVVDRYERVDKVEQGARSGTTTVARESGL